MSEAVLEAPWLCMDSHLGQVSSGREEGMADDPGACYSSPSGVGELRGQQEALEKERQ